MGSIAIIGARLVDARSEAPIPGDTLVTDADGRIAAIGTGLAVPEGATVIDAGGRTVVPGLIDCHVHLNASFDLLHDAVRLTYTESIARAIECGQAFLASGVTTVRDAGMAPAGLKAVFRRPSFRGPRLQASVSTLSITGGHGDAMTPSGIDLGTSLAVMELPSGIADGPDEVRKAVRRQIAAGADWIKVMATGGVFSLLDSPEAVQFTEAEIRVMVEEAANAGIRGVLAHAENAAGIKNALRAGVKSIEHGDGIDDEAIDLMLARDVPLVPTFLVIDEMLTPERLANGATPPWAAEKVQVLLADMEPRFKHAVARGVRVAMGTDGVQGSHLPSELALMVRYGLSPLASLRAATMEGARLLGLEAVVGTLEAGKLADLAVLDFDPLADPDLWRDPARVHVVVQGGEVVARR